MWCRTLHRWRQSAQRDGSIRTELRLQVTLIFIQTVAEPSAAKKWETNTVFPPHVCGKWFVADTQSVCRAKPNIDKCANKWQQTCLLVCFSVAPTLAAKCVYFCGCSWCPWTREIELNCTVWLWCFGALAICAYRLLTTILMENNSRLIILVGGGGVCGIVAATVALRHSSFCLLFWYIYLLIFFFLIFCCQKVDFRSLPHCSVC